MAGLSLSIANAPLVAPDALLAGFGSRRQAGAEAAATPAAKSGLKPQTMEETRLTQLGGETRGFASPHEAVLERVPNPHPDALYLARFTAPEFTALCPVTGQPDFAHLVIDYAPADWLVESKSLKLYLGSFRNHGAFHEDCTVAIGRRLAEELKPRWLRIGGYWYPRGGMPIDVFWQTGPAPEGLWLPDQGVAPYRGRG
jgi:7-cyano-7-deazaguanine reductase